MRICIALLTRWEHTDKWTRLNTPKHTHTHPHTPTPKHSIILNKLHNAQPSKWILTTLKHTHVHALIHFYHSPFSLSFYLAHIPWFKWNTTRLVLQHDIRMYVSNGPLSSLFCCIHSNWMATVAANIRLVHEVPRSCIYSISQVFRWP